MDRPASVADLELEESTDRWMLWGVVLFFLLILAFPMYQILEPGRRAAADEAYQTGLAVQGRAIYEESCVSCHGVEGRGGLGPALNAQQFLGAVDDRQLGNLIATGVPGTLMASYGADFGGSLTEPQISATVSFLRSLEADAPDLPEWYTPLKQEDLSGRDLYTMGCAYCHGLALEGTEAAPRIGAGSEAQEESDGRLAKQIREGGDGMPTFVNVLSEDQIELLVAYLREAQDSG